MTAASGEVRVSIEDREKRARKYGKAHGFRGAVGGWIYGPSGRPMVQGWLSFYSQNRDRIEAWWATRSAR